MAGEHQDHRDHAGGDAGTQQHLDQGAQAGGTARRHARQGQELHDERHKREGGCDQEHAAPAERVAQIAADRCRQDRRG